MVEGVERASDVTRRSDFRRRLTPIETARQDGALEQGKNALGLRCNKAFLTLNHSINSYTTPASDYHRLSG